MRFLSWGAAGWLREHFVFAWCAIPENKHEQSRHEIASIKASRRWTDTQSVSHARECCSRYGVTTSTSWRVTYINLLVHLHHNNEIYDAAGSLDPVSTNRRCVLLCCSHQHLLVEHLGLDGVVVGTLQEKPQSITRKHTGSPHAKAFRFTPIRFRQSTTPNQNHRAVNQKL